MILLFSLPIRGALLRSVVSQLHLFHHLGAPPLDTLQTLPQPCHREAEEEA